MKVGFIGLGHMGAGMAGNLLKAGHEVTVYNRTRSKAEALVRRGAKEAATIADACRGDAVFTMLANDGVVEVVVFGENGILDSPPSRCNRAKDVRGLGDAEGRLSRQTERQFPDRLRYRSARGGHRVRHQGRPRRTPICRHPDVDAV